MGYTGKGGGVLKHTITGAIFFGKGSLLPSFPLHNEQIKTGKISSSQGLRVDLSDVTVRLRRLPCKEIKKI